MTADAPTVPQDGPQPSGRGVMPDGPEEATGPLPLVVGLAPATKDDRELGLRPFERTTAGVRLAALLDVAADRLLEHVDGVYLSPHYLPHWDRVPQGRWNQLARHLAPYLPGRVVVCCGPQVSEALGVWWAGPGIASARRPAAGVDPFLAVGIQHPRIASHDRDATARTSAALRMACAIARTGPAGDVWSPADADAFTLAAAALAGECTP